jgi:N-acetylmuramoyl-L-alanine amidase
MKVIYALLCINFVFYAAPNELQKAFHHRMMPDATKEVPSLERAKIVFYFAQDPIVKKSDAASATKKGYHEVTFFIPQAKIANDEAKQMIAGINTAVQPMYTASVQLIQQPTSGIEVKISYDPRTVSIEHYLFDAITGAKGLELRLYNKSLLDALRQKGQSVLKTSMSKKPTVIIDCGHGGSDKGTVGLFDVVEKDITLAMGKQLSQELQSKGMQVILTRNADQFVALDARTLIANTCPHDAILISLHANNAPRSHVRGLETFYGAPHLFKKESTGLETAIDIMVQDYDLQRYAQSKELADFVHSQILQSLKKAGYPAYDRHTRTAATQVLMGSKWPGILVEMDYVSNPEVAGLLKKNPGFATAIVQGIGNGVDLFRKRA